MIRVLLADDQSLVRSGFRMLIDSADDMETVGEVSNGADAVMVVKSQPVDVVLMDIRMPIMDGTEATPPPNETGASSVSTKRLRLSAQYLREGKREAFYEEVMRALWGYLGDKLRLPVSELSRASVSEILTQRGLEGNLIHELTSVIDEAEFARFAPVREGDMQQLYDRAAQIIGQIDSHKLRK